MTGQTQKYITSAAYLIGIASIAADRYYQHKYDIIIKQVREDSDWLYTLKHLSKYGQQTLSCESSPITKNGKIN